MSCSEQQTKLTCKPYWSTTIFSPMCCCSSLNWKQQRRWEQKQKKRTRVKVKAWLCVSISYQFNVYINQVQCMQVTRCIYHVVVLLTLPVNTLCFHCRTTTNDNFRSTRNGSTSTRNGSTSRPYARRLCYRSSRCWCLYGCTWLPPTYRRVWYVNT